MATSPIYNWPEPDNTDLVKNGALAIRTLGNAIDTTMGTMVAKTVVDAKGDLIAGTAADTVNRLAVGNNGETLVADSSTSTGLRYNPTQAAGKNAVINGGMDIWQRGISITNTSGYTADRWVQVNGNYSITHTRSTDVPSNAGFNYSISCAGRGSNLNQRIESFNAAPFAGQTVTLSFWYKSTAGTDALGYALYYANAADNFAGLTQIGATQTISTPATSWTKVSYTYTNISANAINGLSLYIYRTDTATATTLITGVQLELGSVATTFTRAGGTIQGELAACQRYYYRQTAAGTYSRFYLGNAGSSTVAQFVAPLPVTMRTSPTALDTGGSFRLYDLANAPVAVTSFTIIGFTEISPPSIAGFAANTASGLTTVRSYTLTADNSATAYLGFSAEL